MRNILARVSHKDKAAFGQKLKAIWLQPDRDSAIRYAHEIIEEYAARYPEAISVLEEGLEVSKRRFISATLMFVPHGIRRGLADRTVLYFRGFACKAASVVISGSIREGKLQ